MSPRSKINVYIVDDHALFRLGLTRLLGTFERVDEIWEASNGLELLDGIEKRKTDVVLLDLNMPVMGGKQVCELLEQSHPTIKVIVLSMEDSAGWVDMMIRLGAHSYLSKDVGAIELEHAIYTVFDKGFYYNDLVASSIRNAGLDGKPVSGQALLSLRELEIVKLICNEFTMKEISKALDISEKTVQNHRSNIMDKLGVRNTAGLVKYAIYSQLMK